MSEELIERCARIVDEYLAAYPKDIFIEPLPGQHGQTVDACSARALRGILPNIARDIRALKAAMPGQTTVVHCRRDAFDVYIGRPSKWGNPFLIGQDGNRQEVVEKYEQWLQTRPELLAQIKGLKGKRLGCYCAPLLCHGDVLARWADSYQEVES